MRKQFSLVTWRNKTKHNNIKTPKKQTYKQTKKTWFVFFKGRSSLYWAKFNFTTVCGWPPAVGQGCSGPEAQLPVLGVTLLWPIQIVHCIFWTTLLPLIKCKWGVPSTSLWDWGAWDAWVKKEKSTKKWQLKPVCTRETRTIKHKNPNRAAVWGYLLHKQFETFSSSSYIKIIFKNRKKKHYGQEHGFSGFISRLPFLFCYYGPVILFFTWAPHIYIPQSLPQ